MLFHDAGSIPFQDSPKLDERRGRPGLPLFELSSIVVATDNFSLANRLGQGGFGPSEKLHISHCRMRILIQNMCFWCILLNKNFVPYS